MMTGKKVSLSLHVSPELNSTLEIMAAETHTTKSDILRKAIAMMNVAVKAKKDKNKVGVFDEKNHLINEITGI